jgi:phage baseplate assembly protein W
MSLSIIFPINMNSENNAGIDSHPNTDTTNAIKQNMKMLILTRKGEYVWDPNFGVGLYSYLFENDVTISTGFLEGEIRSQAATYMPYVQIDGINIQIDSDIQALKVQLRFRYNGLSIPELFEVEVS